MPSPPSSPVRIVALVEAFKGALVLVAACGLLSLMHRDIQDVATRLLAHFHLNPASKTPQIFIDLAEHLQDQRLANLAAGAAAYSFLRFLEAYGLYRGKRWAEWLAAVSGGIYIPFELMEMVRHPNWLASSILLVNTVIVGVMVGALRARRTGNGQG